MRGLASGLGTSPATVNAAYRILRERGLVVAQGRRGTRVAPRPALRAGAVSRHSSATPDQRGARDLASGLADPELLPPLAPALAAISCADPLPFARLADDDPGLVAFGRAWFEGDGLPADRVAVVAGALDGIERVLQAHLRVGDRVVIEDPAYPPIRDLLLALSLTPVPVGVDDRGILPDELERALAAGAEAVIVIPRAQNPTGAALDAGRAAALAEVMAARPDLLLVEDDHVSLVSGAPMQTTVRPGRARWAVVRSLSKIVHPDLRIALMTGDAETVARVQGRLTLGPRHVSHILQRVAADLLTAPEFPGVSQAAADRYTERRTALIDALASHGVRAHGAAGLNVWVPVSEEAPVTQSLLDAGWLVYAGERFRIHTPPAIRVTISTLPPAEATAVADVIATTERRARRGGY